MRNLLRVIQVKEFSEEATKNKEPSLVLVLPDVICDSCLHCQSVDICRDNNLMEPEMFDAQGNPVSFVWFCECGQPLSLNKIERRLLELLNSRLITYQMQDLQCTACRMINNGLMNERCTCTATFKQTVGNQLPENLRNRNLLNPQTDIRLLIKLLRNFAQRCQMSTLLESVQSYYDLMGITETLQ